MQLDSLPDAMEGYGVFLNYLNYRVGSDSSTAETLCFRLLAEYVSLRIFWDKKDLKDGEPWEKGFREGLQQSDARLKGGFCVHQNLRAGEAGQYVAGI